MKDHPSSAASACEYVSRRSQSASDSSKSGSGLDQVKGFGKPITSSGGIDSNCDSFSSPIRIKPIEH